jgi:periplasmic mercuric ion binding protein
MPKLLASVALALGVGAASTAIAAERTVTLAVKNMDCVECPLIVRKAWNWCRA